MDRRCNRRNKRAWNAQVELIEKLLNCLLVLRDDSIDGWASQVDAFGGQELAEEAPVEELLGGGGGVLEAVHADVGRKVLGKHFCHKKAISKVPAVVRVVSGTWAVPRQPMGSCCSLGTVDPTLEHLVGHGHVMSVDALCVAVLLEPQAT
jgi:hypothetical protein